MATCGDHDFETSLSAHQESIWSDWDAALPDHLHHYTSLTGMRGILETGVCWATDIRHMNDTTEATYAVNLVQEVLTRRGDKLSVGLLDNFREHGGMPGYGTEWFRYAVCFCATRDLLSQWRGYTREGEGVALVIPMTALRQYAGQEFALLRVCYDRQQQIYAVNSLLDRATTLWNDSPPRTQAEANNLLAITGYILVQVLLRLKHPDFAEEHEWRVLLITWAAEHAAVLRHRTRNGQQVPYVEWRFRREYLDEVLIGPGPFGMEEALPREILAANGLEHVVVSRSRIPLQSDNAT
jgi:hypothetical protein